METVITTSGHVAGVDTFVSIGILAWNEQDAITSTIQSLLAQSLFTELAARQQYAEVVCVANGCSDATARFAAAALSEILSEHPARDFLTARVADIPERGKANAWNRFVHFISSRPARYLFMMDADIRIHRPGTLSAMVRTLETNPEAAIAVDRPCKDLEFSRARPLRARLSLAASRMTASGKAQLCGQLYCMRSEVARSIYLPRDLSACEDGMIKTLVCTDLGCAPDNPERIQLAPDAEHTFEAYTSPAVILRNQKRQVIGQTLIHLLVDKHFAGLPIEQRRRLATVVREYEERDPTWLKRLTADHLKKVRFFWRLYPKLVSSPFARLWQVRGRQRLTCLPAAFASCFAVLTASYLAWRHLKRGSIDYWPRATRKSTQTKVPNIAAAGAAGLNP